MTPRTPKPISGLSEIADRYDAVLCDVWGVIHNGRESFRDACEALIRFQETRGPVVLISNAPRPAYAVHQQLADLGVPTASWSGFVTSGDATRSLLKERAPGPVYAMGPDRDRALYDGLALDFAPLESAAFICCTGLVDDTNETAEDYRGQLETALERDLLLICANPDRVVQRGEQLVPCAGVIADLYEELGGKVLMVGKPYPPTYDLSIAEASRLAGRDVDRSRVLCIGDGLGTDVRGAQNQALDCLFIQAGIHAAEGTAEEVLSKAGLGAAWSMSDLAWGPQ